MVFILPCSNYIIKIKGNSTYKIPEKNRNATSIVCNTAIKTKLLKLHYFSLFKEAGWHNLDRYSFISSVGSSARLLTERSKVRTLYKAFFVFDIFKISKTYANNLLISTDL